MPFGSKPIPPSIFMPGFSLWLDALGSPGSPSLFLAPQEALELRSDLVARRHGVDPHGVALRGVDVLLELAHHGLVLGIVRNELVHLPARAVARSPQCG